MFGSQVVPREAAMRGLGILLLVVGAAGLLGQAFAQDTTARKGTRNYVPETTLPSDAANGQNTLEVCMAAWDVDTHISKDNWREICKRQIRSRAAHSGAAPHP
jgi:hypothetical protein